MGNVPDEIGSFARSLCCLEYIHIYTLDIYIYIYIYIYTVGLQGYEHLGKLGVRNCEIFVSLKFHTVIL